jgi:hypothetical protein
MLADLYRTVWAVNLVEWDSLAVEAPVLAGRGSSEGLDRFEFLGVLLLDLMNGKGVLQIKPELLGSTEIPGEPCGHLGSNSTLFPNNVVHGRRGDPQFH